jgi:hypothetical protein
LEQEEKMRDLQSVFEEINSASRSHQMGQFQAIRREIHGKTGTIDKIFTTQTMDKKNKEWAFHWGGRTELQFNIGFEGDDRDWFRYGVAFSLERSQTLPKPLILRPRILKLNQYLAANQSRLEDLRFWYYYKDQRSPTLPVKPISEELIRVGTFLFWGKLAPRDAINIEEVLFLFDRFLKVYQYVEGTVPLVPLSTDLREGLQFKPGCPTRAEEATGNIRAGTKSILLWHNRMLEGLYKILAAQHGEKNVGTENDAGRGSRVDLVVQDKGRYQYYEIKTGPCIRTCLREALAQLLEYSYWPGGNVAETLIVVSENCLTQDAKHFLDTLRNTFRLPIYHQQLDLLKGSLSDPQ